MDSIVNTDRANGIAATGDVNASKMRILRQKINTESSENIERRKTMKPKGGEGEREREGDDRRG